MHLSDKVAVPVEPYMLKHCDVCCTCGALNAEALPCLHGSAHSRGRQHPPHLVYPRLAARVYCTRGFWWSDGPATARLL